MEQEKHYVGYMSSVPKQISCTHIESCQGKWCKLLRLTCLTLSTLQTVNLVQLHMLLLYQDQISVLRFKKKNCTQLVQSNGCIYRLATV